MKTHQEQNKTGVYGFIVLEIIIGALLFLYGSMTIISYKKKTNELKTQIVQCEKIRNELDRTNRAYEARVAQYLHPTVVAQRINDSMTTRAEIILVSNADRKRGYVVLNPANITRVAQSERNLLPSRVRN